MTQAFFSNLHIYFKWRFLVFSNEVRCLNLSCHDTHDTMVSFHFVKCKTLLCLAVICHNWLNLYVIQPAFLALVDQQSPSELSPSPLSTLQFTPPRSESRFYFINMYLFYHPQCGSYQGWIHRPRNRQFGQTQMSLKLRTASLEGESLSA